MPEFEVEHEVGEVGAGRLRVVKVRVIRSGGRSAVDVRTFAGRRRGLTLPAEQVRELAGLLAEAAALIESEDNVEEAERGRD